MKEVDGLINAKRSKPPSPPASPQGFAWPNQKDHDDAVAKKIAASLQELLPTHEWKHTDLARELWGTDKDGKVRNVSTARAWVVADHPIPNENNAGYIAQVLGVSMARLLEPEGKFDPHPAMIRPRSPNGVNLWKTGKRKKKGDKIVLEPSAYMKMKKKKKTKVLRSRDADKQRQYNAAYRAKKKAEAMGKKRKYVRRAATNGSGAVPSENPNAWVLEPGVPVPEYQMASHEEIPNHVELTIKAVVPQPRAMAILHMLEHLVPSKEE